MNRDSFQQLQNAVIDRVFDTDISLVEARTSSTITDSKSVKGRLLFHVNIKGYYNEQGEGGEVDFEEFHYEVPTIFVGGKRDFYVSNLFHLPSDSKYYHFPDALLAYLEEKGSNTIAESEIHPVRLAQIKEKITEFFNEPEKWTKPKAFVKRHFEGMGNISFQSVNPMVEE